jgi:pantetheine-phosphate adenylyltransferase
MNTAVYPGSFDPPTNGHLDIIRRASKLVDKLIVGVLVNPSKVSLFTVEERIEQIREITRDLPNVEVMSFSGLLVDFVKSVGSNIIIRGLRSGTDFENEFQMALINRTMVNDIETLFITTSTNYLSVSSSTVKEIASFGGNVEKMVPPQIKLALEKKFAQKVQNDKQ